MTTPTIEERLALLEAKVARLSGEAAPEESCETTNEVMTLADMEKQFYGEWVLLEDPYLDEHKQVAGGKVLCHSKNRDERDQAAMRLRPKHSAFLYIGPAPDNIRFNLTTFDLITGPTE